MFFDVFYIIVGKVKRESECEEEDEIFFFLFLFFSHSLGLFCGAGGLNVGIVDVEELGREVFRLEAFQQRGLLVGCREIIAEPP